MNVDVASSRESFPTNSANIEARKLKVNRVKDKLGWSRATLEFSFFL